MKQKTQSGGTRKKGFTLIELLIVIAVVAVLSVVAVLAINPAELLRQSRDASRIADLQTLTKAISLYLADSRTPSVGSFTTCYASNSTTTARCGERFSSAYTAVNATTSPKINGTGWIQVNFDSMSTRAPFNALPNDPVNDTSSYFYAFAVSSTFVFELNANMESIKYASGGPRDVETNDGGNSSTIFETGTAAGLAL